MSVETLIFFIVMSFVTFRISRLIVQDTIFKEWREALVYWLAHGKVVFDDEGKPTHLPKHMTKWRDKLVKLVSCPYCVSVHVAGYLVLIHHFFVDPLQNPVWLWLAIAAGSLIVWEIIDGE